MPMIFNKNDWKNVILLNKSIFLGYNRLIFLQNWWTMQRKKDILISFPYTYYYVGSSKERKD
jgi:hypothetical protein